MSQPTTSLVVGMPIERSYSTRHNDLSRNASMRKVTFRVQSPQENVRLEVTGHRRAAAGGGANRGRMLDLFLVSAGVFTVWMMYFIPIITLSLPLMKVSAGVCVCV